MKFRDMVKEVDDAIRRRDPFVTIDGESFPIADYPGGVRRVVIEHDVMHFKPLDRYYDMTIIFALGGARNRIDLMTEQVVRNFGRQVLRIERAHSAAGEQPFMCLDGSIDGNYVQDIELECTKLVLGVKTSGVASPIA